MNNTQYYTKVQNQIKKDKTQALIKLREEMLDLFYESRNEIRRAKIRQLESLIKERREFANGHITETRWAQIEIAQAQIDCLKEELGEI